MTVNGVMTADARYLCGSWASCLLLRLLSEANADICKVTNDGLPTDTHEYVPCNEYVISTITWIFEYSCVQNRMFSSCQSCDHCSSMASTSAHESVLSVDVDLDPEHCVTIVPGLSKFTGSDAWRYKWLANNEHLCWVAMTLLWLSISRN